MCPLGAAVSAAAGALSLVLYGLSSGDSIVPYLGLALGNLPKTLGFLELLQQGETLLVLGPVGLLQRGQALVQAYPLPFLLAALWATMAGVISLAEGVGRWALGLILTIALGIFGYALVVPIPEEALFRAMTSLSFAAIIYSVIKYLESKFNR
jgi:hypothetical protein